MTISLATIRSVALTRVTSNYSPSSAVAPFAWPGQTFVPGAAINFWTRIDVMFTDVISAVIGGGVERADGFVVASIFARMNQGTNEITADADAFRAAFPVNLSLTVGTGKLRFRTPTVQPIVYEQDGIWCHQPVICNFWLDNPP
jgi:hypothetical protein